MITEDLSEETITYDLNEKAEPLKVQTEESGKLKYLWLKSDDNENFYKIGKSDSQEKTKEEQTGEQQGKTASRSMKIHRSIHCYRYSRNLLLQSPDLEFRRNRRKRLRRK